MLEKINSFNKTTKLKEIIAWVKPFKKESLDQIFKVNNHKT